MLYATLNDHPLYKKQFKQSTKTYDIKYVLSIIHKYQNYMNNLVKPEDRFDNILKIYDLCLVNYKILEDYNYLFDNIYNLLIINYIELITGSYKNKQYGIDNTEYVFKRLFNKDLLEVSIKTKTNFVKSYLKQRNDIILRRLFNRWQNKCYTPITGRTYLRLNHIFSIIIE